jgi:hypothetical protein
MGQVAIQRTGVALGTRFVAGSAFHELGSGYPTPVDQRRITLAGGVFMWVKTMPVAGVAIAVALVLPMTSVAPVAAAGARVSIQAHWRLNEPSGADIAVDDSGNDLHGEVGDDVQTGIVAGKRTGYRFSTVSSSPPAKPQHLVHVPHDDRLNPGTKRYRVAIRMRTFQSSANVVQKGQSGTYGGFWKLETHGGIGSCLFRAGDGTQSGVGSGVRITDGKWHTIVCTRTSRKTVMRVDGVVTDTRRNGTGAIANTKPLTIGGKGECDQISVGCDYFIGDMDFIRIAKG